MNEKAGEYDFEETEFPKSLGGADAFENSVAVILFHVWVCVGDRATSMIICKETSSTIQKLNGIMITSTTSPTKYHLRYLAKHALIRR